MGLFDWLLGHHPVPRSSEAVGLEIGGPDFYPLVAEGTALPASHTETFTTGVDNQSQINVPVLARQGRGKWRALGPFVIRDLSPAAAGRVQLTVTFQVQVDGSVEVSATDQTTGHVSSEDVGWVDVKTR